MVKLYLMDFIKQQRENRYNDAQIKDFLLKNGYSSADVEEAFKYAASNVAPPQHVAQQTVQSSQFSSQRPQPSQTQQVQPKKESHHIGLYVVFLLIVIGAGAGFLYVNGIFGTPAVTMDQLLNMVPFMPKTEQVVQQPVVQAPVQAPVQQPVQPPVVQQPQVPVTPPASAAPVQNNTPAQQNKTTNVTQSAPAVPAPAPAPPVPSAGMTQYSNSDQAISFSYPKEWNISQSSDGKSITITLPYTNSNNIKNEVKLRLSTLTSSISNLNDYTTWIYTQFGFKGDKATSTTFAGKDAYYLQKSIPTKLGTDTIIKKLYLLTSVNDKKGYYLYYITVNSDYDKSFPAIQAMMDSFRYI